jgi:hypothetical protein
MATKKSSSSTSSTVSEEKIMTTENTVLALTDEMKKQLSTLTQAKNKAGNVKLPSLAELTLLENLQPEQLISSFTVSGYTVKPVLVSPEVIQLIVFDYNKKETTKKDGTIVPAVHQTYNEIVELKPQKFAKKNGDGYFFGAPECEADFVDSKLAQKLYDSTLKNVVKQPIILMVEKGMLSKDTYLSTLRAALKAEYKLTDEQANYLGKVFFGYTRMNPEYRGLSPKKLLSYLAVNTEQKELAAPTVEQIDDYTF